MLKKSTLLCSCGGLQALSPHSPLARHEQPVYRQPKRFAHVHGSDSVRPEEDLSWPTSPSFTPYDLFRLERNAPYSKKRFYQLVKIYHPDGRCNGHPQCKDLPESVRLQRYRLLVAAHELLSNPTKRSEYDRFGRGWFQREELFGARGPAAKNAMDAYYSRRRQADPTIFRNASWEDWEQYYSRRSGKHQQQTQSTGASHETFASLFVLLAIFGGVAQAVSIGKYSSFVEDRVKKVNEECGRFLEGRRHQTVSEMDSVDERVQHFLKRRDPSGYGLKEEEEETYRKLLGGTGHHIEYRHDEGR
ncbi:J domain-containing protein 1 [Microsporum ferrugineum]